MNIKVLVIGIAILIAGCKVNQIAYKQKGMNSTFEKFDIQDYRNKNREAKDGEDLNDFKLSDGTRIIRFGDAIDGFNEEQIPAKPGFYKVMKDFYPSGTIQCKGQMFGNLNPGVNAVKIGKWYFFDKQGVLEKEVDEDTKFGTFRPADLLAFLDKDGILDVQKGKNREKLIAEFEEGNDGKKIWKVRITQESVPESYSKGWAYEIDGNTGKVLRKYAFTDTIRQ